MKIQEAVKKRILELSQQKELTINKIADNCFMTTSTLQNIMNGNTKSSEITTITKICYGLNITIKEFFNSPLFDDIDYIGE